MEFDRKIVDNYFSYFLIAGSIIYLTFLGWVPLFDWDEINFAECAREMIILQNYLSIHIDFEPFWEKPPLFIWLQVLSMQIFGVGEAAARYPNAILGFMTLPLLYYAGTKLKNHSFGMNWAILYACSFLPLLYFKSGIIDPWFNTFIFLSYLGLFVFIKKEHLFWLIASGISLGLAILTKGPAALLILGICGLIITLFYRRLPIPFFKLLLWTFFVLLVPSLWFLTEYIVNGPFFVREFITYQIRLLTTEDAGHGGFPGYHFVVVLLGCFPASVIAFPQLIKRYPKEDLLKWMQILLWVVLILFSLVQSKIIHYSSLTYFPLTFLAAEQLSRQKLSFSALQKGSFIGISVFWFLLVAIIPFLMPNALSLLNEKDLSQSAVAVLSLEVDWPKWLSIIALLVLIPLLLHKVRSFNYRTKMISSAICYILFIEGILLFYIPRVEQYTQGPAIEFYKEKSEEVCYVENWGYKTYADLFYTKKMPHEKLNVSLEHALLNGTDLPLYIVTKVYRQEKFEDLYPMADRLYQKGEFVFYERKAIDVEE